MVTPRFDDQGFFRSPSSPDDIEKTKKWFADMFSMKVPETVVTDSRAETQAEYSVSSDARCKLASSSSAT